MNLVDNFTQFTQTADTTITTTSSSLDGVSLFFLIICCCFLLFVPFGIAFGINYLNKLSQASERGKYVPSVISRIWYRTILITPRGLMMMSVAVFGISLSFISIDFSFASTAAIFLLVFLVILWFYGQMLNLYLFYKKRILGQDLIKNNIVVKSVTEGDAVKTSVQLKTPFPIGFLLKMTMILPPELGGELRTTNAIQKNNMVNMDIILPISRRGEHEVGPIIIEYQDIFGFSSIKLFNFHKTKLTIYPRVKRLRKLSWQSASTKIGDEFTVKRLINSDDHFDIREYRRGDDVRKIHWKMTAKSEKLMLRIPEITYVTTGNFLLLIDNVVSGNYKQGIVSPIYEGTMTVLDRMLEISATIIDFTLKNNSKMKVIYNYGYNSVKKKEYQKTRREEWLKHMSSIKWKTKTNKNQSKIFDLIVKESETTAGIFIVTSEVDSNRYDYLAKINNKVPINIIYVDPGTFLNSKEKRKKKFGDRIFYMLFSKPYLDQYSFFDNLLYSKLQPKHPQYDLVQKIKKSSRNMYTSLKSRFASVRYIDKNTDYISILEKEL